MRRFILLVLALYFLNLNFADAFNVVYPKHESVTINSPRTFFIGSENPEDKLFINNDMVNLYHTGGFKHCVELNYGKNVFVLTNETGQKKVYTIYRQKESKQPDVVRKSYNPSLYTLTKDAAILRISPVDRGLNRLQELPSGVMLEVIGEYGDFYNVRLGRDGNAWIAKKQVLVSEDNDVFGEILDKKIYKDTDKTVLKIFMSKKLPYYISENEGLELFVFNANNAPFYKYEEKMPQKRLFGYKSYYTDENVLVIEMKNIPQIEKSSPLKNLKIVIDPGHGGNESGTTGCLGTKEKDINLILSQKLKTYLSDKGAKVYLTRENDTYLGLYDRVNFANNLNADIFISIHNNALPDQLANKDISGTEVYYFYPQAKELAKSVMTGVTQSANTKNNGVKGESYAVIRNSQVVSILLEVAYMINPPEDEKLGSSDFQDSVVKGIADGLEKYINDIQK